MKFTRSWLNEYLEFSLDTKILETELTNLGLEVETVQSTTESLKNMYVCQITNTEKHPNADRLKVCELTTGSKSYKVVCGAPNAEKGLKSVFAPNGSFIPGKTFILEKKNIRGIEGDGMLCSEEELGLSSNSNGIIELDSKYEIGKCLKNYVEDDYLYEIALTPNRGDCASVRGVARDLSAKFSKNIKQKKLNTLIHDHKSPINWDLSKLTNNNLCPLILGRHFKIEKNPESPFWLQKRLIDIGLKPISALVDITNYILFDIGRPLHVFDSNKISGNLFVKLAEKGDDFTGLDNKEYFLTDQDMVVSDEEKVLSLAGIMGGVSSCVTKDTKEVFLEVAYFDPDTIANSGRRHNIVTDARYRFERGIDKSGLYEGLNIATALINEICGGKFSEISRSGKDLLDNKDIFLNYDKFEKTIGYSLDKKVQLNILKSLGCNIKSDSTGYCKIIPPSWRHDLTIESDLIEEIARIEGYDKIDFSNFSNLQKLPNPIFSRLNNLKISLRELLAQRGLNEIISFTFISPKKYISKDGLKNPPTINNPISLDMSVMRNSLLPNLLDAVAKNFSKGIDNIRLFEVGYIFEGCSYEDQKLNLGLVLSGYSSKRSWHLKRRYYDFFDIKSVLMETLGCLNIDNFKIKRSDQPWFHPGKSADISVGELVIGSFGEIHPEIAKKFNLKNPTVLGQIDLQQIENLYHFDKKNKPKRLSPFLILKKDFSFLLPADKTANDLIRVIKSSDNLIGDITIFDVYREEKNESVLVYLGIEVQIKQTNKVLNSDEIGLIMDTIVRNAKDQLGAQLRG